MVTMENKKSKITGVILAGGTNSRFGSEKALVKINNIRIIERTLNVMKDIFSENIVISNNEKLYREYEVKIFPDLAEGKGPLMGVYTALYHSSTDVFVTACDMPFIDSGVIKKIVSNIASFDAVIPLYNGKLHFLHAVYSLQCLDTMKKKLDAGIFLGLKGLLKDLNCNILEEFKFEDSFLPPFFNMNTPDDYDIAKNYYCGLAHSNNNKKQD